MADPFRRVKPGEDVTFHATSFNAMLAAGEAFEAGKFDRGLADALRVRPRDGAIVKIANESGSDLVRGSVLGLGNPIFTPTDDEDAFLREVAFRGVEPTSSHVGGKFGILLDPLKDGAIGRACVAGACPVQVSFSDSGHGFAAPSATVTTHLVSAATGPASILWSSATTGTAWAIVLIGTTCGG